MHPHKQMNDYITWAILSKKFVGKLGLVSGGILVFFFGISCPMNYNYLKTTRRLFAILEGEASVFVYEQSDAFRGNGG